jgi:hypothetical protein
MRGKELLLTHSWICQGQFRKKRPALITVPGAFPFAG